MLQYDGQGRVKTHIKSNNDLLNPDSIPLTFKDIIDPRPITITYSFDYDAQDRLVYFRRNQLQAGVDTLQQDEEWKFDLQGTWVEHNFWTIQYGDTSIKNLSVRRIVYRDSAHRVVKIDKLTYSFADKKLVLSESARFGYHLGILDTITTYAVSSGQETFSGKKYAIVYDRYDPIHIDSLLFKSYTEMDATGGITTKTFGYDSLQRMVASLTLSNLGDTVSRSSWVFAPYHTTEMIDDQTTETYFDVTGYERYDEEFSGGSSLGVPANMNTREVVNGEIQHALLEVWDPVTLFYRKDTEYVFGYDAITGIQEDVLENNGFQAYPNPTSGQLFLKNWDKVVQLELISMEGIVTPLPLQAVLQLNVSNGLYLIRASFLDGHSSQTKIDIR